MSFIRRFMAVLAFSGLLAGPLASVGGASTAAAFVVVGEDAAAAARVVAAAGGDVGRVLDVVGGVSASLTPLQRQRVEGAGFRAVPDTKARVASTGFDAAGDLVQVAALNPVDGTPATAGAGVGVALIDTGVTPSPEFADRLAVGPDLSGEGDGIDRFGHGTFMAGLVVGSETGSAPGAHLVSVKVAGRDGTTSLSTVLDGIDWVIETRDEFDTRVLSLSLAVDAAGDWHADPLAIAVEEATRNGLLVVAASGNEAGTVASPGIAPSALTVGASDHNDTASTSDDTVAAWSGSERAKPELVAPGVAVVSVRAPGSAIDEAHPDARVGDVHMRGSGTSMATALAAGAAAVLGEQAPDATPAELKSMLVEGGVEIDGGRAVDLTGAESVAAKSVAQPQAPHDNRRVTWAGDHWSGTRWAGTRWAGTRWAGTRWAGTRWAGTRWAGTRWAGTRWAGTRWAGTRWAGTRWAGTRWAGTRWAGTRWAAADLAPGEQP